MHDRLEALEGERIAHHALAEAHAIDHTVARRARKGRLDGGRDLARVELMHHRIRVVHRHAAFGKEACGRRFAHADRAGEPEDDHWRLFDWRISLSANRCPPWHQARSRLSPGYAR